MLVKFRESSSLWAILLLVFVYQQVLGSVFVHANIVHSTIESDIRPTSFDIVQGEVVMENSYEVASEPNDTEFPVSDLATEAFVLRLPDRCILGTSSFDLIGSSLNDFVKFDLNRLDSTEFHSASISFSIQSNTIEPIGIRLNNGNTFLAKTGVKVELPFNELKWRHSNRLLFTSGSYSLGAEIIIDNVEIHFQNAHSTNKIEYLEKDLLNISDGFLLTSDSSLLSLVSNSVLSTPSIRKDIINVTKNSISVEKMSRSDIGLIAIGIDRSRIPAGYSVNDVQTFYFDQTSLTWKRTATIDTVYLSDEESENSTDFKFAPDLGYTQYFNGIIKMPEMPEASAFMPTNVTDIKAANPAEGISFIQPPSIDRKGDASVSFPISIPQGRQGMTPSLNISYNSSSGTGILGMGWSIPFPSIKVDTRWGAPLFDPDIESESYTYNGQSLSMQDEYRPQTPESTDDGAVLKSRNSNANNGIRFFTKNMNSNVKIERFDCSGGSNPSSYFWIVTEANGTKHYFGTADGTTCDLNSSVRVHSSQIMDVGEWLLKRTEDKWGNYIIYDYEIRTFDNNQFPNMLDSREYLIKKIKYTGSTSGQEPAYEINFIYSDDPRDDATIDYSVSGLSANSTPIGIANASKLEELTIQLNDNSVQPPTQGVPFRKWKFDYVTSQQGKTLLHEITEFRNGLEFYSHQLEYYDNSIDYHERTIRIPNLSYSQSSAFNNVPFYGLWQNAMTQILKPSPLGTSTDHGWNASLYLGIGATPCPPYQQSKTWTLGGSYGKTGSNSYVQTSLTDVNGDGIPDVIRRNPNSQGIYYRPIYYDSESGTYTPALGDLSIIGTSYIGKTKNDSESWDFQINPPFSSIGWNTSTQWGKTNYYTSDVNADGFFDLIENSNVHYGILNPDGSYSFSQHSKNTPNPVLKTDVNAHPATVVDPIDYNDDISKINIEVIKTWRAPFDGVITIYDDFFSYGNNLHNLNDGIDIAIQHNNAFIFQLDNYDGTGPINTATLTDIVVHKGDLLQFRVRNNDNGFDDSFNWNPKVNYTSLSNSHDLKFDENGLDWSNSAYNETSGNGSFYIGGQKNWTNILIQDNNSSLSNSPVYYLELHNDNGQTTLSLPSSGSLTDDLRLRIDLVVSSQNAFGAAQPDKSYIAYATINRGTTGGIVLISDFQDPLQQPVAWLRGPGQTPEIHLNQLGSGTKATDARISFSLESSSNIKWHDLNWRPVLFAKPDINTPEWTKLYPVVNVKSYDIVHKQQGRANTSSFGYATSSNFQMVPELNDDVFINLALPVDHPYYNSSSIDFTFVAKEIGNGTGLYQKYILELVFQAGSLLTYFVYKPTDLANPILSESLQVPSDISFDPQLSYHLVGDMSVSFYFPDNAKFLAEEILPFLGVRFYETNPQLMSPGDPLSNSLVYNKISAYSQDLNNPTGVNRLGWGQFSWKTHDAFSSSSIIPVENIHPNELTIQQMNDLDNLLNTAASGYNNNSTITETDISTTLQNSGNDFQYINYLPLIPERYESVLQRTNDPLSLVGDQYTAHGYSGRAFASGQLSGFVGEVVPEDDYLPDPPLPTGTIAYRTSAVNLFTKSYTKAYSAGFT